MVVSVWVRGPVYDWRQNFDSLAVALEIPVEEVESYIFSALGRME